MNKILNKLSRIKKTRDGWVACCPAHRDSTPSMSLTEKEGKVLIHCFSGCSTESIIEAIGLEMSDLFLEDSKMSLSVKEAKVKTYGSIEEIKKQFHDLDDCYVYNWLNEDISLIQIRYRVNNKKQFATYHKDNNYWVAGKGIGLTPLYNIDGIKNSKSVLIVEGEKLVNILKEYGIPATTSLGGALNAENTDWTPLAGKASVVIWRDYNEPGLKYQNSVCNILANLGVQVRKVEVEKLGLNVDDDLEQFIEKQTGSKDEIKAKIISALPKLEKIEPISYLKDHLVKVKKGEIKNWTVPFFPMLTNNVRAFKPGTQTVIVSAGGVGKSLFAGRMSDDLVLHGNAKIKRLHLESSMSFYLLRSLAQQSKCVDVMNEEFQFEQPDKSDMIVNSHEHVLNRIGETITTSDSGLKKKITEWNADGVKRWMTANADCDILIIDPVSMVLDTSMPWITSTELTKHAEELMSQNEQLCVVWIQHTAESSSTGNVGAISGGKAWNRFSSSILEMISLDEPEEYEILMPNGDVTIREVQTYIKIKKCRNGRGANWKIAMYLDTEDLTYKELGRMLRKHKK